MLDYDDTFETKKDNFLTDEIKHNMTVSAYGELMVMRWVNAGNDFTIRLPQSRSSFIRCPDKLRVVPLAQNIFGTIKFCKINLKRALLQMVT